MPQQQIETYMHQILVAITDMKSDLRSFVSTVNTEILPYLGKQLECNNDSKAILETVKTKIETFHIDVKKLVRYDLVNEQYERNVEELAYRKRHSIKQIWFQKRNNRNQAFFNILNNEGTAKIYQHWLNTKEFLPRKYKPKKINGEPQEQYNIREQLGFAKMNSDLDIMKNQIDKNVKKLREADDEINKIIERVSEGNVREKVKAIWKEEVNKGEENATKRWQKKEEWLKSLPANNNQQHPPQQQFRPAQTYAEVARNRNNQRPAMQNQSYNQQRAFNRPVNQQNFQRQRRPWVQQHQHNRNNNFQRGRPTLRQTGAMQQRESVFRRLGPINPTTYTHSGPPTGVPFHRRGNYQNMNPSQQRHRITNNQGGFLGSGGRGRFNPPRR